MKSQRALPFSQRKRNLLFCHRNSTVSNTSLPVFCADLFRWFSSLFLWETSLTWLKYSLTFLKYSAAFQTVVALLLGLIIVWLCEWTNNDLLTLHVCKSRIRIKWQFQLPPLSIWQRVWPREKQVSWLNNGHMACFRQTTKRRFQSKAWKF